VSRRLKLRSITKCADMKMRFIRAFAFAGQRRSASGTKSAPPARRRIELRDLTISNDVRVVFERHEDGDGRTAMLPATLAMAPRYRFRLSGGHEAYGAAQATAFELIAHAAELSVSKFTLHGNKILVKLVFLRFGCPRPLCCQSD
jgi:hypothetical protein